MATENTSLDDRIRQISAFREAIYQEGLTRYRDAQFELVDAILCNQRPGSFAELTLTPTRRRGWGSAYAALENGRQEEERVRRLFCKHMPPQDVQVLALDTTVWPHPGARTLSELAYEYRTTKTKRGFMFVKGHRYSLLDWVPERGRSWALPIDSRRLAPNRSTIWVAIEQVKDLCRRRAAQAQVQGHLAVVADTRYGTHHFLGPLQDEPCAVVVRLRKDRVLYGPAPPYGGRGRPRKHGHRFVFKDPESWPSPDAETKFDDERWGQVHLRAWNNVHAREDNTANFNILLAEVHLERQRRPQPLWLAFQGAEGFTIQEVWQWFDHRWAIEPSIRFRKQRLHWTLPAWQRTDRCDRWTLLTEMAYWQLFLARQAIVDQPLPWQQPQAGLTPGRVLQSFALLFGQIETPARSVKQRGKSSGWQKGRRRRPPPRFSVMRRSRRA